MSEFSERDLSTQFYAFSGFHRSGQPRNALDHFVRAWEHGDRSDFEATLGDKAKASLHSMLRDTTWEELSAEMWRSKPAHPVGLGY